MCVCVCVCVPCLIHLIWSQSQSAVPPQESELVQIVQLSHRLSTHEPSSPIWDKQLPPQAEEVLANAWAILCDGTRNAKDALLSSQLGSVVRGRAIAWALERRARERELELVRRKRLVHAHAVDG